MVNQKKKIIYIALLIIYLINAFSGIVTATQIDNAQIIDMGDCRLSSSILGHKTKCLVLYNYNSCRIQLSRSNTLCLLPKC